MNTRELLWAVVYAQTLRAYRQDRDPARYAAMAAVEDFDAFFAPPVEPNPANNLGGVTVTLARLRGLTLGERIKEAYEAQSLTRAGFQRLLQNHDPALATLNYKTIVDWEHGATPRLEVLRAIASVLGCTVEQLDVPPAPDAR